MQKKPVFILLILLLSGDSSYSINLSQSCLNATFWHYCNWVPLGIKCKYTVSITTSDNILKGNEIISEHFR